MKTTAKKAINHSLLFYTAAFIILALLLISGCSKKDAGSTVSAEGMKGAGSVSFSIQWPGETRTDQYVMQTKAPADGTITCADLGVTTIDAVLTDAQDTELGRGSWPCDAHSGTIANVPAGSGLKIVITAKDSPGNVLYQGQKTGLTVTAEQNTAIGAVTMYEALKISIDSPQEADRHILTGDFTKFNGTVNGGTGDYIYKWSFGGNIANATVEDPGNIMFEAPGSYTITFTVTDSIGVTNSTSIVLSVRDPDALDVRITTSMNNRPVANNIIISGQTIDFQSTVTGGKAGYTYVWSFPTGSGLPDTSILPNPSRIQFTATGNRNITLTVTDAAGKKGYATTIVTVNTDLQPTAAINSPATDVIVVKDRSVPFAGTSGSGNPDLKYIWTLNGGATDVSVEDPGNVTFSILGTYKVTFTVTDADGDSASAYVNVKVVNSGWQTPQRIDINNAGSTFIYPSVAVSRSGNSVAVWSQGDGGTLNNMWANYFTAASGTWGTAQLIETSGLGSAALQQVAMDDSGNAIAVWGQDDGTRYNIYANRYNALSGTWGAPQFLEIDDAARGSAEVSEIAMDGAGNAVVVWEEYDTASPANVDIWANRYYAAAGYWGTAQHIENSTGISYWPDVAMNNSGSGMAVWYQHTTGVAGWDIWASRFFDYDIWRTADRCEQVAGDAATPQVAINESGNVTVVWCAYDPTDPNGLRHNILANRYTPSKYPYDEGTWGTAQVIENDSGNAVSPKVAMDSSGNAIAVWSQSDGTRNNIWANRYTASPGTWDTAQLIETDNAGHASNPQIAIDSSGNAIVVWEQSDGTRTHIWVNHYTITSGTWSTAQLIGMDYTGSASRPTIAVDGSGNATVVWIQSGNVWATRYLN